MGAPGKDESKPAPPFDGLRTPPIELEPLKIEGGDAPPDRDDELEDYARPRTVPSHPLHQCPTCDYILTGLTGRRCPECGEIFDLREARLAAIDRSLFGNGLLNSPWFEQVKVGFGVLMLFVGFSLPCMFIRTRGSLDSVIMAVMLPAILLLGTLYKATRDLTWAQAMILMGSVTLCLGLILSFT